MSVQILSMLGSHIRLWVKDKMILMRHREDQLLLSMSDWCFHGYLCWSRSGLRNSMCAEWGWPLGRTREEFILESSHIARCSRIVSVHLKKSSVSWKGTMPLSPHMRVIWCNLLTTGPQKNNLADLNSFEDSSYTGGDRIITWQYYLGSIVSDTRVENTTASATSLTPNGSPTS